jgi:hypothetical protein
MSLSGTSSLDGTGSAAGGSSSGVPIFSSLGVGSISSSVSGPSPSLSAGPQQGDGNTGSAAAPGGAVELVVRLTNPEQVSLQY